MAQLTATHLSRLAATFEDSARQVTSAEGRRALAAEVRFAARAATETLPWLRRVREGADVSVLHVALQNAATRPFELAFEMGDERLTWDGLDDLTSRLAYVLAFRGVVDEDVVALLGTNSPSYVAFTLGVSRVGGVTALLNHQLEGRPLQHAIAAADCEAVIIEQPHLEALLSLPEVVERLHTVFVYRSTFVAPGEPVASAAQARVLGKRLVDLDAELAAAPRERFPRVPVHPDDDCLYIYTSGTTGLPKPCRVNHGRAVLAGAAYALFFGYQPGDKLYNVLPLYHSNGMLLGVGSTVFAGTPMALSRKFSARQFWPDVHRYQATAMLYIGELARYLVNAPPCAAEAPNPLRVAVGNGLRPDVWPRFQERFDIKDIREFYGATEAPGLIINLSNKVGALGRVPFRRLTPMKLVKYDVGADEHPRDSAGHYVECDTGEVGELVFKLSRKSRNPISAFRGYTDDVATRGKILTDVFEPGDEYYRSGDLLRHDAEGFFYFVDRIGDTYRWKGENVSTAEVADVLSQYSGAESVTVVGVKVPGAEGQAGLAVLVCADAFDPALFWATARELPVYAQPRFVRLAPRVDTTGTLKIKKTQLAKDGCDPTQVSDPLYVLRPSGYVPLTRELWEEIIEGRCFL